MAAVYLHNALFSPEPSEDGSGVQTPTPRRHSRHISSQSLSTSLHTSSSEHSHPTEPLLKSSAYMDMLARQPTHPSGPSPGWDMGLDLTSEGHQNDAIRRERRARRVKKSLKRLNFARRIAELIIGAWAIYNTVRYFIAFATHPSQTRQIICLILGASTSLTFSLLVLSTLFSVFYDSLISHNVSGRAVYMTRMALVTFASFFLLGPAVVNLVIVFLWRYSSDDDLKLEGRCDWAIDALWTFRDSPSHCPNRPVPAWGVWLATAIARLSLTMFFILAYFGILFAIALTRTPPSRRGSSRPYFNFGRQNTLSMSSMSGKERVPFRTVDSQSTLYQAQSLKASPTHAQKPSQSSLATSDEKHSRQSTASDRRLLGSSTSLSRTSSLTRTTSLRQLSSSHGHSSGHDDESDSDHSRPSFSPRRESSDESPDDLRSFADRFRALVSQITRETEEGMSLERPEPIASTSTSASGSGYSYGSVRDPYDEADEFGRPVVDDQGHVRVLGGYIRRMPTIESLGSREVANSSLHRDGTPSRPPTRTTTLTLSEGPPSTVPSRASSLAATGNPQMPLQAILPSRSGSGNYILNDDGELVRDGSVGSSRSRRSTNRSQSHPSPVSGVFPSGIAGHVAQDGADLDRDPSNGSSGSQPPGNRSGDSYHTPTSHGKDSTGSSHESGSQGTGIHPAESGDLSRDAGQRTAAEAPYRGPRVLFGASGSGERPDSEADVHPVRPPSRRHAHKSTASTTLSFLSQPSRASTHESAATDREHDPRHSVQSQSTQYSGGSYRGPTSAFGGSGDRASPAQAEGEESRQSSLRSGHTSSVRSTASSHHSPASSAFVLGDQDALVREPSPAAPHLDEMESDTSRSYETTADGPGDDNDDDESTREA